MRRKYTLLSLYFYLFIYLFIILLLHGHSCVLLEELLMDCIFDGIDVGHSLAGQHLDQSSVRQYRDHSSEGQNLGHSQ